MEIEYDEEKQETSTEEEEDEEEKKENKRKNSIVSSIVQQTKPNHHAYLSKSFNEILLYFDEILASKNNEQRFNNADIEYILTYHPDYEKKELVYLSELVVKRHFNSNLKKTRLYAILFSNEDDKIYNDDYISLNRCIRNALKPINEESIRVNHVRLAFYNTIRGYPVGFSVIACEFCIKCKKLRNVKLYCGEKYLFNDLLEKFMNDMKLGFSEIGIAIVRSGIILKDIRLADRWSTFYIERCGRVQYICYDCIQIQLELQKNELAKLDEILMTNEKSLRDNHSQEGDEEEEEDYMITSPHTSIKLDSSSGKQCNVSDELV